MATWYNENDKKTAAWLRELIKAGLIADGEIDERSIADVQPADLAGFTQCHFFAGIGGWSYALRLAGWPDDRAVWTGSCPCQPFSSAGDNAGGADPRHLWPAWFRLIRECRPVVVFGEQVESAIGHGWIDLVCDDLEGEDYAAASVGLPAACVGAFHERARLWFVADSCCAERRRDVVNGADARREEAAGRPPMDCAAGELADADRTVAGHGRLQRGRRLLQSAEDAPIGVMGDSSGFGLSERKRDGRLQPGQMGAHQGEGAERTGDVSHMAVTNERGCEVAHVSVRPEGPLETAVIERGTGFWSAVDWIPCADGSLRPVEPGTFPLAHGLPARVGRLRGYGNAIVPPLAAEFIKAYREAIGEDLHGL